MNREVTNVLGPYSTNNWISMKALREQNKWMQTEDPEKFKVAIRKNKYIFGKIVDKTIDLDDA